MRDGISRDALVEGLRRVLEDRAARRPGRLVGVHELDAATLILEPQAGELLPAAFLAIVLRHWLGEYGEELHAQRPRCHDVLDETRSDQVEEREEIPVCAREVLEELLELRGVDVCWRADRLEERTVFRMPASRMSRSSVGCTQVATTG